MKHRLFSAVAALCAALSAFSLASCHEDTIIKSSLTPAIDNIHTFGIGPDFNNSTDTITIRTRTVYADSIITSARGTGYPIYHALGAVDDPFAGRTAAGIYMQFSAPATGFSLGSNTLDYVELVLPYAGFKWGDTTVSAAMQNINVYRITQSFSKDSTFYNFNSLTTDPALVGTGSYTAGGIDDSVNVGGTNRAPHLRIRLSDVFRDFLKDQLVYDTSVTAFTDAFRGLAIMPDSTPGRLAMAYFILNNSGGFYGSASLLAHVKLSGGGDTMYSFPYLEASNAHFNRITRNYNGYPAAALLNATADNSTMALMQNAPGAQIDVRLPYIQLLPKNVIINKAELVFRKIDTYGRFFAPSRVLPFGVNSSGGVYTVADRYPVTDATLNFIDGTPRLAAGGLMEYRINIPREVQRAIVQGSDGLHLRIGGTTNFPAAYRLLVGGDANVDARYRPSVNIIYSKQ